jgi:hypothetical protein
MLTVNSMRANFGRGRLNRPKRKKGMELMENTLTREQWLNLLKERFRDVFKELAPSWTFPEKLRISVGWPSKNPLGRKKRSIGQCWHPDCSEDGSTEIFISPFLGDAYKAAETVLHELVHAVVGTEAGHKGQFVSCAKKLGFMAPWTQTPASDELKDRIANILGTMPPFPHAGLDAAMVDKMTKKQGTRMLKAKCQECGYTVRTTKQWLDKSGAPLCPCNTQVMAVDGWEGEQGGDEQDDEGQERLAA